jgi:hypothetical protein
VSELAALMARALASEEGKQLIDGLADRVATRVRAQTSQAGPADGWLDSSRAAEYLGLSLPALHRLTCERRIAFSQERAGGKCWFKRSHLDAFREADLRQPLEAGEAV